MSVRPMVVLVAATLLAAPSNLTAADRKAEFVKAVVRGAGLMPWQSAGPSDEEIAFRGEIEARKDQMLAERAPVFHPVLLSADDLAQARRNIDRAPWAATWLDGHRDRADYIVSQPEGYVEAMIPELTPWYCYGMTCPNCVGSKSQEAMGNRVMTWNYRQPEQLRCRFCDQTYPDDAFPETAELVCPRAGQTLTFYLNEAQRQHPEDRSGRYAWHWVGRPTHVSFSGMIRLKKATFMIGAARSLGIAYAFTADPRYAEKTIAILDRLASCYRHWLYHDYWDAVADCDPMYAAWHDRDLRLEWKRHLCTSAYEKDTVEKAAMLRDYWGAGRLHPSCDGAGRLIDLALAYDLVHDAEDAQGRPLWTIEVRRRVERDLFMEWLMGGEPFLGGAGKAANINNKSGRVYSPMATVAKCLGITQWADTALQGFEALAARSLTYDGFSHESPAYTFSGASYLGNMLRLAEALHGFRWPAGFPTRSGDVNLYAQSERFRLLMQAQVDCLRPDGRFPPLSDTPVGFRPSRQFLETGLKRLPHHYGPIFSATYPSGNPSEYAVLHLDAEELAGMRAARPSASLPEIFFPAWMTAILRHGRGGDAAMLTLHNAPPGGHRHADSLALFYETNGKTILGDHGYIGDTPMNAWFHHTFSHNLVIVDDQAQNHRRPPRTPRFHLMAVTPRLSLTEGSSDAYPQCSEYRRLAALVKGPGTESFVIDIFRVRGGKKHDFRIFSELAASDAPNGALTIEGVDVPPEPPLPSVGASTRREDIFGRRDIRRVDKPSATWRAVWTQDDALYRLWMLTPCDRIELANGPGQQTVRQAGRRVRYLDALREGEDDLATTFVAIHEPGRAREDMPIQNAVRLQPPPSAGANAVALRLETRWGTFWAFSDFEARATVDGITFQGEFGLYCRQSETSYWLASVGSPVFQAGERGFADGTATWSSRVRSQDGHVLHLERRRPQTWPRMTAGCEVYLRAHDGHYETGFPVAKTTPESITVRRFPVPQLEAVEMPAIRYLAVQHSE